MGKQGETRAKESLTLGGVVALPELARSIGISPQRMRRRLRRLQARDGGAWLFRMGERHFYVNVSMLKAAHPELFPKRLTSEAELEALLERVRETEMRLNGLAARVREFSRLTRPRDVAAE